MNDLLSHYTKGNELEFRFYVDPRNPGRQTKTAVRIPQDARVVAERFLADHKYETQHTIDVYAGSGRRKQLNFPGGKSQSQPAYMIKHAKNDLFVISNDLGGYRGQISSEVKVKEFALPAKIEAVRIKVRASAILPELPGWRVDITLVKNATQENVANWRTKMIYPFADFGKAPWAECDWVEFEFEYVGGAAPTVDIRRMYEILLPNYNWKYYDHLYVCAQLVDHPDVGKYSTIAQGVSFAGLLPKAREITYQEYVDKYAADVKSMTIRDKIEGKRQLVHVKDGRLRAVDSNGMTDKKVECKSEYLFDCESLDDKFYVLHVLVWDGKRIGTLPETERNTYLDKLGELGIKELIVCPLTTTSTPKEWWERKTDTPRDGLLLSTPGSYWNQNVIKWKPKSTIDFLAIECPKELEGKAPFVRVNDGVLHLLCMGSNARQTRDPIRQFVNKLFTNVRGSYQPHLFEPANRPTAYIWEHTKNLHGKIVELAWNGSGWQYIMTRQDKISILEGGTDMGNNDKVVADTWAKIHKPFTIDQLTDARPIYGCASNEYDDIIDRVPNDGRVLLYKTNFIPKNGFKKITYVGSQNDYLARQSDIEAASKKSMVKFVNSDTPGFTLPPDFIGGSSLTIAMVDNPRVLDPLVAYGGVLILLCKHSNKYPGMHVVESSEDFCILSKESHGRRDMTPEEVRKENPHLAMAPNPNFEFKFMRQKTKDIPGLTVDVKECKSLVVNAKRGELLCDIEFLSQTESGCQVYYHDLAQRPYKDSLMKLFPDVKWVDTPSKENVEYLISWSDYKTSAKMIEDWNPVQSFVRLQITEFNMTVSRGKMFLIPYQSTDDTSVMLQIARRASQQHILKSMFASEMAYYHRVYRSSGFKFHPQRANYDNCYDCRSEIYIISKYMRRQKNQTFEAVSKIVAE